MSRTSTTEIRSGSTIGRRWRLATAALIAACSTGEAPPLPLAPSADVSHVVGRNAFPWSEPVWLGPIVNSTARDLNAELAPNGLSLYFSSEREGSRGLDIWVSRRAREGCPWESPVNIGTTINTDGADGAPNLSPDGRMLFFSSDGHGGFGDSDIFVSRRADTDDDLGWGPPINLGPEVNTEIHESGPDFIKVRGDGELYFNRSIGQMGRPYVVPMTRDGRTIGPAAFIAELSDPSVVDGSMTLRADGREAIFWSGGATGTRPGSVGLADLWVSTRRNVKEAWSPPRNLGTPVNSQFADLEPGLSHDGRTLVFSSAAARGGLGFQDLWMSTRGPNAPLDASVARSCQP